MSEKIGHVSDTAFWVAYYRWVETRRKDALFRDPLALKLAGDRGARLARHMGIRNAMAWSMALRTYVIDQYILQAVASGIDAVVNLGAGLDTRPYRLELNETFPWVEVDFSPVLNYKGKVLETEKPRCRLERIACDLADEAARQSVLQDISRRGSNILVLTEGVIPYLSNDNVAELARDLRQHVPITHWLTDYFSPLFMTMSQRGGIRRRLADNAPFRFFPGSEPLDWPTFFAAEGWQVSQVRFIGEEGQRLGRPLPANPLARLMMHFAPEERLRPYRRMNGYVMLTPGYGVKAL